ncbi:MAG: Gfo/Idh/MocA family oxidoreductase, partial [Fimbriimonadaceae bacterium]|nr:Gfo/Idh/MocA family oxidoreductase [Fimbriimonadaceae bacterium]
MADTTKIRAGVIGYGGAFGMGKAHADQMIAAGFEFVAACDTDAARVEVAKADFPGIAGYTDYRDLLKDPNVDLVVVILPHNLHAPVAIEASETGKHVVVEKPMCIDTAEADAMIAAANKAGKMLSVYHNRRWDGFFMTMRDLIEAGEIGSL